MISLRQKLLLGMCGLLIVLVGIGIAGVFVDPRSPSGTAMLVLFTVVMILGLGFIIVLTRSVLRPLRLLTQSAREIANGNLDLVTDVRSDDEIGELAAAFNAMAARLREFRAHEEARLQRVRRTTQLAIDSLPHAVAVLSPDGHVELANKAAGHYFGLTPATTIDVLASRNLADLLREVIARPRRVEPRGYEGAIQLFDNCNERFFLPHIVPIVADDGEHVGFTVVLVDATELRRTDEAKSNLISTVSHELKTPLTSIQMCIHMLHEDSLGPLTPRQAELLLAARDDSDRLSRIIANLLDMARIQAGRTTMQLEPSAIRDILAEVLAGMEASFQAEGILLTVDVPEVVVPVLADRARIGHVLANLLSNALKYTPGGGKVRITVSADPDLVTIAVADTGPGIPPDYLSRIFDKFVRVPTTQDIAGVGLGLAIAKEIVEAHGGHISVDSTPGRGSTFRFTLRRAKENATSENAPTKSAANALAPIGT